MGFGVLVWLVGQADDTNVDKAERSSAVPVTEAQTTTPTLNETDEATAGLLGADKASLFVSGSRVNLRSGPGVGNKILGQLNLGEKVALLSTSGGWREIETKFGVGWMSANYLHDAPLQPTRAVPKQQQRKRAVSVPTSREVQAARNEIIRHSISATKALAPARTTSTVPDDVVVVGARGQDQVESHRCATTAM